MDQIFYVAAVKKDLDEENELTEKEDSSLINKEETSVFELPNQEVSSSECPSEKESKLEEKNSASYAYSKYCEIL